MGNGFRHEAFLYAGDEHFVAGAAAFVREALDAREAVLVAVVEPRAWLLRRALGRDADRIEFVDLAAVGRNPARILPLWQDWVDRQEPGARGFRGIGEPVWPGRTAAEIVECRHHEHLLNTAFDGGPGWWLLCPYDVTALPPPAVRGAYDTHPVVVDAGVRQPSPTYPSSPHPEVGLPAVFGEPLPEPADTPLTIDFDLAGLGDVRDRVARFAEPILGRRGADNAVLVVSELAANSVKYGGGGGRVRVWREDGTVVCEVRDDGVISDPLAGRRRPSSAVRGKAGLWIVNQLSDLLRIRSAPGRGTVVRAHLARPGSPGPS